MVRVRFAPSPTGYLHIGGARTALFNWLYARRQGGTFVLRIEDTDSARSSPEMVAGIVDGLRWLGLDWDEGPDVGGPHGPYFQSERLEHHRAKAERLVAEGRAYYCYCSPESLQERRQAGEAAGGGWVYERTCCSIPAQAVAAREAAGEPRAVRFKVPPGETSFVDAVHGSIAFANANIEDFVILRSDGQPTYHLSVVADDIDMAISHVIRGDDHISNTPKHVLLYCALGADPPTFAHVPLILGPDRKRLSKRHGATSVMEYHRLGYVPEAMVNFLSLLGWSPGEDRELFDAHELVSVFSLDGISGGNAVFNPDKLDWFNQQHIMRLPLEQLAVRVEPVLQEAGLWRANLAGAERPWLLTLLALIRPRVKRMGQFVEEAQPFLRDGLEYDSATLTKHFGPAGVGDAVETMVRELEAVEPFDRVSSEEVLRRIAGRAGIKAAALIHASRLALTGRTVSPGLFEVMEVLGRERSTRRLRDAQKLLSK